jgi:hypothetical protein
MVFIDLAGNEPDWNTGVGAALNEETLYINKRCRSFHYLFQTFRKEDITGRANLQKKCEKPKINVEIESFKANSMSESLIIN